MLHLMVMHIADACARNSSMQAFASTLFHFGSRAASSLRKKDISHPSMNIIVFRGETSRRARDCMQDMQTSESRQTPTCASLTSRLPARSAYQSFIRAILHSVRGSCNSVLLLSSRRPANIRRRALKGQVVFYRLSNRGSNTSCYLRSKIPKTLVWSQLVQRLSGISCVALAGSTVTSSKVPFVHNGCAPKMTTSCPSIFDKLYIVRRLSVLG